MRKGEHGTRVYFVKQLRIAGEGEEDAERLVPMMREYTVFNVAQCEGLPAAIVNGKPQRVRNPDTRDDLADAFLAATNAVIREGQGEAYYAPGADFISMPSFAAFKGADHFYNVGFHELTHWTGHKSRLARDLSGRFGKAQYAAEELIAELGAAFLAAEFGFDGDVRHAGYIATWITLLRSDKRAVFTAASKAQAAADYLRLDPRWRATPSGSSMTRKGPPTMAALFFQRTTNGEDTPTKSLRRCGHPCANASPPVIVRKIKAEGRIKLGTLSHAVLHRLAIELVEQCPGLVAEALADPIVVQMSQVSNKQRKACTASTSAVQIS